MLKTSLTFIFLAVALAGADATKEVYPAWVPDRNDGTYQNPIIHADYSDPDVTRVGDEAALQRQGIR